MFLLRDDVKKMSPFATVIVFLLAALVTTVCGLAMSTGKVELLSTEKIGAIAAVVPLLPIGIGLSATMYVMHRRIASLLSLLSALALMLALSVDYVTAICLFGAFSAGTLTLAYFCGRPSESRFKRVGTVGVVFCAGYVLWLVLSIKNGYGDIQTFVDTYMEKTCAAIEESINLMFSLREAVVSSQVDADEEMLKNLYSQMGNLTISVTDIQFIARQLYLSLPSYIGVIALWTAWFAELIVARAHTVFGGERILVKPKNTTIPAFFAVIYVITILAQLILPDTAGDAVTAVVVAGYTVTMLPCAAAGLKMLVSGFKRMRTGAKIALVVFLVLFGVGFLISFMAVYGAYSIIANKLRSKMKKTENTSGDSESE